MKVDGLKIKKTGKNMYQEIEGDLIKLAKEGKFDVIAHGCNCFCTMKSGIAPQMAEAFTCDKFPLEHINYKGNINKLGQIDHLYAPVNSTNGLYVRIVNCYTQYYHKSNSPHPNIPCIDYQALQLCLLKINHIFKGKHIGLPQIGCGQAGGDWDVVRAIIKSRLRDCDVTVVIYKE